MGRKIKKDYMQDVTFAELIGAAEQALAYERDARDGYRIMLVESTKSPRKVPASKAVPKSDLSSRQQHKNADDK
ncbi:MAG: hypothetical protein ABW250_01320 [Pyrinomonadaceae bacterium]